MNVKDPVFRKVVAFGPMAEEGGIMGFSLYPGAYLDSPYEIDFEKLYKAGFRGLVFDIDNTLVPHGAPADQRAVYLFHWLQELGFSCMILSNNKEPRVKNFCDSVGAGYIFKAGKPKSSGYRRAMEQMGTDAEHTIFIGDQIFTDICGANFAGMGSVLVRPIHPKEEIQIVLKRIPERLILLGYRIHRRLFGSRLVIPVITNTKKKDRSGN